MPNPYYQKKGGNAPPWLGARAASAGDMASLSAGTREKIDVVLEAMEWPELVVFSYSGLDRVVACFVVGVSSLGKALIRGYQVGGASVGGVGVGWRVFEVDKMVGLESYQEFFDASQFGFDRRYPWLYRVFVSL